VVAEIVALISVGIPSTSFDFPKVSAAEFLQPALLAFISVEKKTQSLVHELGDGPRKNAL
jgi:hypothetical protein